MWPKLNFMVRERVGLKTESKLEKEFGLPMAPGPIKGPHML